MTPDGAAACACSSADAIAPFGSSSNDVEK